MANEEVLRLRATVVSEEGLAQLRAIGREIGALPQKARPALVQTNTLFANLTATVGKLKGELLQVAPGLSQFGFGAASVALGASALVATLTRVAAKVTELRYVSDELGMSEVNIRAWSKAAEKAGIAPETMMQGLKNFKQTTDGFKYNIGGIRDELIAMGAGPVVQRIMAARTETEKLKETFDFSAALLKADPSQYKAQQFLKMMGFTAEATRITLDNVRRAQEQMRPLTPEQMEAAKKFNDAMIDLGHTWDRLAMKLGVKLFPFLSDELDKIGAKLDETSDEIKSFLKSLEPIQDWWSGKKQTGELPDVGPPAVQWGQSPLLGRSPNRNPRSGYHPTAFGGGDMSDGSRMVKDGVFAALVDFKGYVEGGGGGAGGFSNASFGGSSGGGAGGRGWGGGGYSNLTPGTGGGSAGAEGDGVAPRAMGRLPGGSRGTGISKGGEGPAGPAGDTADSSKVGNEYLASQRSRLKAELDANPELKRRFAAIVQTENPGAGTAVAESAMNRAAMSGRSMASILSGGPRSFYGPARRGQIEPTMRNMSQRDLAARYRQIDEALGGSNQIRGHTDQGSAGDPNYSKGGVGVNINRERFNDWGGYRGVDYSRQWRMEQQAHVNASRLDSAINTSATGGVKAEGNVNVAITSNGTAAKASATADGLWQKTTIQNYKQMQKTESPNW